jgi:signal transduction histidine kinase
MIPLLLIVGAFLSQRALHPLREMIQTVEAIQAGNMSSRVPTTGTGDELDELAHLFNSMLEQIEKLIKGMQDSLDSVGHDLRTPITRLRATAELALQSNGSGEIQREALADCMEETDQILVMLETLMDISEAQTGVMQLRPERVNVSKLIEDTIDLYRYVAEDRGVLLGASCPSDLYIDADSRRIRQALANLVDNAVKYTEKGGKILIDARSSDHEAIITVSDTGAGIHSDDLPKIWERLYRSTNVQTKKGIGLGLSLVRAIIQSHGGVIEAASELNKGSIFTIHLPLSSAS